MFTALNRHSTRADAAYAASASGHSNSLRLLEPDGSFLEWAKEIAQYSSLMTPSELYTKPPFEKERFQKIVGKPLTEITNDDFASFLHPSVCSADAIKEHYTVLLNTVTKAYPAVPGGYYN